MASSAGDSAAAGNLTMQNRYVRGHRGLSEAEHPSCLVTRIPPWCRMGLFPDESHNRDGRHICYLHRPDQWRHYDPELFDVLAQIVSTDQRDIRALEAAGLLPGAIHSGEMLPIGGNVRNVRESVTDGSARSDPDLQRPRSCSLTQTMDLSLRAIIQVPPRQVKTFRYNNYMNWRGQGTV